MDAVQGKPYDDGTTPKHRLQVVCPLVGPNTRVVGYRDGWLTAQATHHVASSLAANRIGRTDAAVERVA